MGSSYRDHTHSQMKTYTFEKKSMKKNTEQKFINFPLNVNLNELWLFFVFKFSV